MFDLSAFLGGRRDQNIPHRPVYSAGIAVYITLGVTTHLMRTAVTELVALGRLPEEAAASVPVLESFERAIQRVEPPLSDEEALGLLSVFPLGEASCFGLAWSVVHLVESAPGWPMPQARLQGSNPWVRSLLERAN